MEVVSSCFDVHVGSGSLVLFSTYLTMLTHYYIPRFDSDLVM